MHTGVFGELLARIQTTYASPSALLTPTNLAAAHQEFLDNPELTVPRFEYGKLNPQFVRDSLDELDSLLEQIRYDPTLTPIQRDFLRLRRNYNVRIHRFLRSCLQIQEQGEDTAIEALEPKLVQAQLHANTQLYGAPNWQTFLSILQFKLHQLEARTRRRSLRECNDCVNLRKEFYDRVLTASHRPQTEPLLPLNPVSKGKAQTGYFKPKVETVLAFGDLMRKDLASFLRHVPEEQESFTMRQAYAIVDEILRTELPQSQFRAELREGASALSVSPSQHLVQIPAQRGKGDLNHDDFCAILIGHELGTHLRRTVNFEDTTFGQLWPDAEAFEEGLACAVEQSLKGKFEPRGVFHYINLGCATFLRMNFREVYETDRRIHLLDEVPAGQDREEYASKTAFLETWRCFRGTGVLPNFKDLVYYNGTSQAWKFIETHLKEQPDYLLEQLFRSGKSDPTNSRHQRFIKALHDGELN